MKTILKNTAIIIILAFLAQILGGISFALEQSAVGFVAMSGWFVALIGWALYYKLKE